MAEITGAQLLVECIRREGVKHVFGVPGAQPLTFTDALGTTEGIDFVLNRHEQASAHMADAWARVTGELGACLGTVGPGALDLVPGVATAYADSSPMLVLTAQTQSFRAYPSHGSQQELDQLRMFAPITKFGACVHHVSRIPELVRAAARAALAPRQGPAHLDLPADILFQKVELDPAWLWDGAARAERMGALSSDDLDRIVAALLAAERPLIFLGKGVHRAGAWTEARELAEHLGAAVTTTAGARGAIPDDHPQAFVALGWGAIGAQASADVVLAVGTRFGELTMFGRQPMWGERSSQKILQIDADPQMIGLNTPVTVGAVADARVALSQILAAVREATGKRPPHPGIADLKAGQEGWLAQFAGNSVSEASPMHPLRVAKEVRDFFPRDAIAVVDGGNCAVWATYLTRIFEPRSFLWAGNMGHLGAGLPFAVAAKLARPDKQVFVLHGDGAFMFLPGELETARRLGTAIVDVIFDDQAFGMIKAGQRIACESRHVGVDFAEVHYDEIARAMGCYGERVTDPNELGLALKRAVDSGLPAVLDVVIDQAANLDAPDLATLAALWLEGC